MPVRTRVSTLAKTLDDSSALMGWKQEVALRGVRSREDLLALLMSESADAPKEFFRGLAKQAEEAAAVQSSANLGTAIHRGLEARSKGASVRHIPESVREDVIAAHSTMLAAGLEPVLSEQFVDVKEISCAGSFDHLVRGPDGQFFVLDLKTSGNPGTVKWAALAYSIQLASYAHGDPYTGPVVRDRWGRPTLDEAPENYTTWKDLGTDAPDREIGFILHVIRGTGEARLHQIDLQIGWRAAQLACDVRALRADRTIARPA